MMLTAVDSDWRWKKMGVNCPGREMMVDAAYLYGSRRRAFVGYIYTPVGGNLVFELPFHLLLTVSIVQYSTVQYRHLPEML